MKESNPSNRRFCDIGDVFYNPSENTYMFCENYYKRHYMHYTFTVIHLNKIKEFMKIDNPSLVLRKYFLMNRVSKSRYDLDKLWDNKKIVNPEHDQLALLNLCGLIVKY